MNITIPWLAVNHAFKKAPSITINSRESVTIDFVVSPTVNIAGWEFLFEVFRNPRGATNTLFSKTDLETLDEEDGVIRLTFEENELILAPTLYGYKLWRTNEGAVALLASGSLRIE